MRQTQQKLFQEADLGQISGIDASRSTPYLNDGFVRIGKRQRPPNGGVALQAGLGVLFRQHTNFISFQDCPRRRIGDATTRLPDIVSAEILRQIAFAR